ncbi:MAG: ATP-binding protein, partial [Bacteroidota bacterium]
VEFDAQGLQERLPDATLERLLYQSSQEIITNALKYAEASRLTVQLFRRQEEIQIMVSDNGKGMDATSLDSTQAGLGLENIKELVQKYKGDMHLDSSPQAGTTITLTIPI